jgi:hypothetical protein
MFEESGIRPVVYNNKCGQMCGVSLMLNSLSNHIDYPLFLVLRKKGLLNQMKFYF